MSQQLPFLSLNFASEGISFARTTSILCQAAVYCYRYYDIRRFSTALTLGAAAWSKVCNLLQWPLRFGSNWLQHSRSHHWRKVPRCVICAAMVKDIFGRDRFHCTNAGCKCLEPHGGINHGWEIFERWFLFNGKIIQLNGFFLNIYPLVNIQKAMENHHAINGKIHEINGHFPLLFVSSPEGNSVWLAEGILVVSRSLPPLAAFIKALPPLAIRTKAPRCDRCHARRIPHTKGCSNWILLCLEMGMSENGVYPQWNSHLVGIMIINHWV